MSLIDANILSFTEVRPVMLLLFSAFTPWNLAKWAVSYYAFLFDIGCLEYNGSGLALGDASWVFCFCSGGSIGLALIELKKVAFECLVFDEEIL